MKGSVFSFNNKLYKHTDGCGMGNPLSPVLANIFMCKLEEHIIPKHSPVFYHRYVNDCLSKRKKNSPDHLLQSFNAYHPNITFTVEETPLTSSTQRSSSKTTHFLPPLMSSPENSPCTGNLPHLSSGSVIRFGVPYIELNA